MARGEAQPSAEQALEQLELSRTLSEHVLSLREAYRTTIYLRYYEGLPPKQIAERLGVPEKTVKSRLSRGIAELRLRLDREGGGRDRWHAPILAMAFPCGAEAASAVTLAGWLGGATAMKKAVLILAVVLLGLLGWQRMRMSAPSAGDDAARPTNTLVGKPQEIIDPSDRGSDARTAALPAATASGPRADGTPPFPDLREPRTLRGRVLGASLKPVEGAKVLVAPPYDGIPHDLPQPALDCEIFEGDSRKHVAVTDADGKFELTGPRPGAAILAVRAPGHAPLDERGLVIGTDAIQQLDDLVLESVMPLIGRVVDPEGRPVADARLYRLDRSPANFERPQSAHLRALIGRTDAAGSFRLDQLPVGPWRLLVESDGFPPHVARGTPTPSLESEVVVIQLPPGLDIGGRVDCPGDVDPASVAVALLDLPKAGYSQAQRGVAPCAPDGRFSFRCTLPPEGEQFQLRAVRPRPERGSPFGWLSEPVTVTVGDRDVRIRIDRFSSVVLDLVDAAGSGQVAAAELGLHYWSHYSGWREIVPLEEFEDHERARYRARVVSPDERGWLGIQIDCPGFQSHYRWGIHVLPGHEVDLGSIRLVPHPIARVHVVDHQTGLAVEGARVVMVWGDLAARPRPDPWRRGFEKSEEFDYTSPQVERLTDPSGLALVPLVDGEACWIAATHDDYVPARPHVVEGRLGESPEIELHLDRGGRVRVRVIDQNGDSVLRRPVWHVFEPDGALNQVLDARESSDWKRMSERPTLESGIAYFDRLSEGVHLFGLERLPPYLFGLERLRPDVDPTKAGWESITVQNGAVHDLTMVAPKIVSLHGMVTTNGLPLTGAELALVDVRGREPLPGGGQYIVTPPVERTGSDGGFRFSNVRPGDYVVQVRHPSRAHVEQIEVTLDMQDRRLDIQLAQNGIRGRVLGEGGVPLESAWAVVVPRNDLEKAIAGLIALASKGAPGSMLADIHVARTGQDGAYQIDGVSTGIDLAVLAIAGGYVVSAVEIAAGSIVQGQLAIDHRLKRAGELKVQVEGADPGTPLQLDIRLVESPVATDDRNRTVGASASSPTRVTNLAPGTWSVVLRRVVLGGEDPVSPSQNILIHPGAETEITLRAP